MALAYALAVPMIGVSSLDLVAFPARFSAKLIVAVLDARRGEVFSAFYRHVPGGIQRVTDHRVGTPQELANEILAAGEECLMVGDGASLHQDRFDDLEGVEIVEHSLSYPSAESLVQLAHAQALREEWVQPWEVEPLYLRLPDAEINWTTRDQSA
jgi:tRNA threonylcarbamoyladenosine biosynthesis protein TsaB